MKPFIHERQDFKDLIAALSSEKKIEPKKVSMMVAMAHLLGAALFLTLTSCIGLENIAVSIDYTAGSFNEEMKAKIFKLGSQAGKDSVWVKTQKRKGGSIFINVVENNIKLVGIYFKQEKYTLAKEYLDNNDKTNIHNLAEDQKEIAFQIETLLGKDNFTRTDNLISPSELKSIYLKMKEDR